VARKAAQQSQTYDLNMVIDQLIKDKGIDRQILVRALESAMQTAAKKTFGQDREIEARFNMDTGAVDLFQFMEVAEDVVNVEREIDLEKIKKAGIDAEAGDALGIPIYYRPEDEDKAKEQDKVYKSILGYKTFNRNFGRIAAQIAKQVITQKLRDAERDIVYNEYKDSKSELVAGIVRRFERGNNVIVDLGRAEAVLPGKEQIPKESFRVGDRIQAFIKDIDREAKSFQIILSRADSGFLRKLFEQEVPEIAEGIVRIVNIVREPGSRAKVAVASRDVDVDPVGACVGMKGSRVQAIVQELRGEKIDIVPWDKDPARFVCNAISPAEVTKVIIDEPNGSMELIVPDEKLSLAIGKKGQNVRLAGALTNWHLDIMSESVFKKMEDETIQQFTLIAEIDESLARTMYKLGFRTMQDLIEANPQELAGIPGLGGTEKGNAIREAAQAAVEEVRRERIREAAKKTEPLTTRERLLFITGVGERTVELLEQKGYENVEAIAEEDVDKFAIRTGLGLKKAKSIIHGARQFLASEKTIMEELASQTSQRPIEAEVVLSQAAAEDAQEVAEAPENGADDDKGERDKINKLDEGW
jgi:N utilization substance protein A